ncbi:hypothetical protein MGL_0933 [Malassezia globosa CBS 7966]|uniref:PAN2-PAN3 deadenylation complex subunit PAN3 n=1 Tax=Malassezia globosa (strain ATCC MYA-4612 / CBS 7966) TaxID=425265 RepID=A8PVR0_MALGO|nr:uncharacterized protein MGL_0933 [Malassezia globosa CBS 7966]EDP44451.1 hypothetical protein MGL_0933 [Malassezia globosa CBS 7966]
MKAGDDAVPSTRVETKSTDAHSARKDSGTSLSNVLSSSNASLATISFQPRSTPSIRAKLAEAPVFVPRSSNVSSSATMDTHSSPTSPITPHQQVPAMYRHSAGAGAPAAPAPSAGDSSSAVPSSSLTVGAGTAPSLTSSGTPGAAAAAAAASAAAHGPPYSSLAYESFPYDAPSADARAVRHPLQYHLYAPPFPHVSNFHPTHHAAMTFFMDPTLQEELHRKQEAFHAYKATCALDGKCYVLRRIENVQLSHPAAIGTAERWRKIRHPGIVAVREAFTTRAFGDHSIVFVYDFHPLATTLYMEHMTVKPLQPDRRTGRLQPVSMHVPERVLWSYACQLASLLRVVHGAGLAARCIEPSKVLRTGHNRLRLNGCAIFDVLLYQAQPPADALLVQQRDDLTALGRLLLCTGCNNVAAAATLSESFDAFQRTYSAELVHFVHKLVHGEHLSITDTLHELTPYLADEVGSALYHTDLLEAALMRELENGRLVRLLCKLNTVDQRPEYEREGPSNETGERYVLRLFRDMVFHAVDERGHPTLDLSHVLVHLNKLDAGVDERLLLMSRDELNCVIVSYADIKRYVETAFLDLTRS